MTSSHNSAELLIREAGARVAHPRITVLTTRLTAPRAMTHHEIERRVRRTLPINRVTVYRVLEWLVANQLAHRNSGDDRVWRCNAVADEHGGKHAHFKCSDCARVICLEDVAAPRRLSLPAGYRSQRVELTVQGRCAARSTRRATHAGAKRRVAA